jgi:hypothetical protein
LKPQDHSWQRPSTFPKSHKFYFFIEIFIILCCPIMCLFVLSSVLWCPLPLYYINVREHRRDNKKNVQFREAYGIQDDEKQSKNITQYVLDTTLVNIFDICSTIFEIKNKNKKKFCVFFTRKTGFPFDETPNVGQSRAQLSI